MPAPVVSLSVVPQRWDCHSCGECCRSYSVSVTAVEKARLESQGWGDLPEFAGVPPTVADGRAGQFRLNQRPDGSCVFLGADNRCRVHAKFGGTAKPMSCQIYPFILVPTGDHWRVGMRLACPSAVANRGRPLADHAGDVRDYATLLEADAGVTLTTGPHASPPPPLQAAEVVPWADLIRFAQAFAAQVADDTTPLEYRLRNVLAVAALCRKSRFEAVTGARLTEFLEVITAAVAEDVPRSPDGVAPPSWLGRTVFRQVAAIYSRKDAGTHAGISSRSRGTRLRAAWRFAVGRGPVPKLHGQIPAGATFEAAEQPQPLSAEGDALLTRFFRLKLESLQFCGPTNFRRPFWAGLDSLLLTYPVIRWLGRVFAADGRNPDDALRLAVQAVDDSFGFNPMLGGGRQAWGIRTLAERNELAKLVAWYGR